MTGFFRPVFECVSENGVRLTLQRVNPKALSSRAYPLEITAT